MEEDYLYSQKLDHQVLNGIADPIRVLDSDERVIFVNEAMEKTLGYDRKNLLCDIDESIFNPDITRSVLRTGEVVQREEIIKDTIYSVKCSPVLGQKGQIIGVVEVFRNVTVERRLQREIIERNRAMVRETMAASQIQKTVVPEKGFIKNLKIDYIYKPSNMLSGDMFDVFEINEDNIAVYISDSVGHGFAASMVTMFIKSLIRTLPIFILLSPAKTLDAISNRFSLLKLDIENYFTCFYGVFNIKKGIFTYANAGHLPLPLKVSEKIEYLHAEGNPISRFFKSAKYKEENSKFYAGDKILFMTDGVSESRNLEGEVYGLKRPEEIMLENDIDELSILKDNLLSFMNITQTDDISVLLLSVW